MASYQFSPGFITFHAFLTKSKTKLWGPTKGTCILYVFIIFNFIGKRFAVLAQGNKDATWVGDEVSPYTGESLGISDPFGLNGPVSGVQSAPA